MYTTPLVTAAVLVLMGFAGCIDSKDTTVAPNKAVTAADNGRSIDLAVGNTLDVALESNPSTGYAWKVRELDTKVLAPRGAETYSTDCQGVPGCGGTATFRFEALAKGTTTLTMAYEGGSGREDAGSFNLTVVVT